MGQVEIRVDGQRAVVTRHGVTVTPGGRQCQAMVRMRLEIARFNLHGLVNQRDGLDRIALLGAQHAQQMKGSVIERVMIDDLLKP